MKSATTRAMIFLGASMAVVGPGLAQQVAVSPAVFRDRWAAGRSNAHSFGGQGRALMLHTDVPAMTVSQISWRQHPLIASYAAGSTIQLWIGDGRYANRSLTFAQNFVGTPTEVIRPREFNFPFVSVPPLRPPSESFVFTLPFDQPWVYTRAHDLAYMFDGWNSRTQNTTANDEAELRDEDLTYGVAHGTGCFNTFNNTLAVLQAESAGSRGRYEIRVTFWSEGLRPNALTSILVGTTSVSRFYPFLCNFQYVDGVFHSWVGLANSRGEVGRATVAGPYDPLLVGARLHMQGYCLDDGRHPLLLPVTLTNGVALPLADMPPPWVPAFWMSGGLRAIVASGAVQDLIPVTEFR